MPNLLSFSTCCVDLELRPLPSTGITRLPRYYGPLRHPKAPGLSLAGVRLVIADHAKGLPVLRALPLCACCRHYPGAAIEVTLRSFSPNRISLLRRGRRIGLRNVLFEACSAFTHVTAYTLAGSPKATPYIGGFSYFVTSIAAPIASGRSDLAGWDFHPLEKRRLITAHTHSSQPKSFLKENYRLKGLIKTSLPETKIL